MTFQIFIFYLDQVSFLYHVMKKASYRRIYFYLLQFFTHFWIILLISIFLICSCSKIWKVFVLLLPYEAIFWCLLHSILTYWLEKIKQMPFQFFGYWFKLGTIISSLFLSIFSLFLVFWLWLFFFLFSLLLLLLFLLLLLLYTFSFF